MSLGDLSVYSNNNIYPFLQSNDVFPARFAIVLLDGRGYVNKGISVFSEEKSDTGSRTTGVQGKRDVIYDKRIRQRRKLRRRREFMWEKSIYIKKNILR